jgi:NAD(P)-dependent dehydrogenase (short-subunit alcohol dehydrogenase family)
MSIADMFSLEGYCAMVTGAARGLGQAMATALAQAGASIVIADVDTAAGEAAAEALAATGASAISVTTDVTKPADAAALVDTAMARFGRIDVLINNAGIASWVKAEDMEYGDWRRVIDTNLSSVFVMSQAVGRQMIEQKRGSIINISSMSGLIVNTPQEQCAYNASKGGVIMLTKSLASEWAKHHVRVNTIAPGYMKTELLRDYFADSANPTVKRWMDMSPMGRPGRPEELGGIAVYLASEASSFVTGGVFVIDGGYTVW